MSLPSKPRKPVPRGFLITAGAVLLLAGVTGLIVLGNTLYARTARIHSWEPVPCTVQQAETKVTGTDDHGNLTMKVRVELTWEYKGLRHTGGKLDADRGFSIAESINSKEEICYQLRRNPQQTCYVNPDNAEEATLRLPEWWPVLVFAGLSLLFILAGAGLLLAARKRPADGRSKAPGGLALTAAVLLGLVFLAGGYACWWFGIREAPDWKIIGPRMKEVPCHIVSSFIEMSRGGRTDSPSYIAKIYYRYQWDGRVWHSDWYDFDKRAPAGGSRDKPEAAVQRYRRDTDHTCWVDPEQPWMAVLEKTGGTFSWIWFPAILCALLGSFFVIMALVKLITLSSAKQRQDQAPSEPPPRPE